MSADIVVVGAGLMGTAIARCLSKFKLEVIVVERESDICFGTSKATSAIVHTGYTEQPGTLKAQLVVKGHHMMEGICSELEVPFKIIGDLDIVLDDEGDEGIERIKGLRKQGEINGVRNIQILEEKDVLKIEPGLKEGIKSALYTPDTGTVSPYELAIALMENAIDNGVKLLLDSPVLDIFRNKDDDLWTVKTSTENIDCNFIINTAGLFTDKISSMVGAEDYQIKPGKGEEYLLDSKLGQIINHIVERPLGFIMPTTHGNLMMGTTVVETSKDDFNTTPKGFDDIYSNASKLAKGINKKDIINSFAGLRAYNNKTNDYIIKPSEKVSNFIHVSIGSPGVVASPAVAEEVKEILFNHYHLKAKRKEDFNPYRKAITIFRELSQEEKEKLIKKDEKYGHIVCRCETITEGEIVEAIKRGARTLDGIKYRTRAGMGRCQGGFCTPRVLNIMARELHVPVTQLTKKGKHSILLPLKTKQLYSYRRKDNETY